MTHQRPVTNTLFIRRLFNSIDYSCKNPDLTGLHRLAMDQLTTESVTLTLNVLDERKSRFVQSQDRQYYVNPAVIMYLARCI